MPYRRPLLPCSRPLSVLFPVRALFHRARTGFFLLYRMCSRMYPLPECVLICPLCWNEPSQAGCLHGPPDNPQAVGPSNSLAFNWSFFLFFSFPFLGIYMAQPTVLKLLGQLNMAQWPYSGPAFRQGCPLWATHRRGRRYEHLFVDGNDLYADYYC